MTWPCEECHVGSRVACGRAQPYVVVLGNEKGGSGKSTVAMHIAVALLKAGQRVATIDLDSRQKSFTHYIENRRAWAKHAKLDLEIAARIIASRAPKARWSPTTKPRSSTSFAAADRRGRAHPRFRRHRYAGP